MTTILLVRLYVSNYNEQERFRKGFVTFLQRQGYAEDFIKKVCKAYDFTFPIIGAKCYHLMMCSNNRTLQWEKTCNPTSLEAFNKALVANISECKHLYSGRDFQTKVKKYSAELSDEDEFNEIFQWVEQNKPEWYELDKELPLSEVLSNFHELACEVHKKIHKKQFEAYIKETFVSRQERKQIDGERCERVVLKNLWFQIQ